MAFKVGASATTVIDSSGNPLIPVATSASRPSVSTAGTIIYNTTTNRLERWTGSAWTDASFPPLSRATTGAKLVSSGTAIFWAYPGNTDTGAPTISATFKTRTIITHGYLAGGYKGSNPWRSVNKCWHANDTTYYCGEQIDQGAAYVDGAWSDYNAYIYGSVDSFTGSSAHTSSYNLHTGIMRQRNASGSYSNVGSGATASNFNYTGASTDSPSTTSSYGGWDMSVARDYHGAAPAQIPQVGYVTGGGSSVTEKHNFTTEIMYTTTSSGSSGNSFMVGGENYTWQFASSYYRRIAHSNDTWDSSNTGVSGTDGIAKGLMSKWGHSYISTSSNVTLPMAKMNTETGASISTFNKVRAYGEENFMMGQDWGYMMGQYDGQQNNHTVKHNYSTDSQTTMGANTRPKGHYGQSSGCCSSAAASLTAMYNI